MSDDGTHCQKQSETSGSALKRCKLVESERESDGDVSTGACSDVSKESDIPGIYYNVFS